MQGIVLSQNKTSDVMSGKFKCLIITCVYLILLLLCVCMLAHAKVQRKSDEVCKIQKIKNNLSVCCDTEYPEFLSSFVSKSPGKDGAYLDGNEKAQQT